MSMDWLLAWMSLACLLVAAWQFRSGYLIVTIRGHSMLPTFRDGDRLLQHG